ncbi:glycoside hydrolase 100 family protein [Arcticibacter eurypsychrophilus]|uniref:glycoside hydrolase 100 family protein n=1 Tax=Arcticibacter eurypsychrophilus TaxID=1434752 RepID=UPI00084D0B8B|nr:glycoside hydrolase 100 family protein [Arcticibacter eurypsychrophilus]
MQDIKRSALLNQAITVLKRASTGNYILAAATGAKDNYDHIWARDCAVTGLSILTCQIDELYIPYINSLKLLQKAANHAGQIPSNIKVDQDGSIMKISFGGTAGRTDASFWWLIGSISYLKQQPDDAFYRLVSDQASLIFALAENWEFNGKGLMYVPMSSNWADEYITHGYVLFDQLLRYWALSIAGTYFDRPEWTAKASEIKTLIRQHFLLEQPLKDSLYTLAQQQALAGYELGKNFIASFTPGDRVERFDGWSIGLLLMLDIPSPESIQKLVCSLQESLSSNQSKGIPAFWPEIKAGEVLYQQLLNNHSYDFKNKPGHFHNGGIWPVVNGFLIAGLMIAGESKLASDLTDLLFETLETSDVEHPFAEYYDLYEGKPGGMANLCFSAAGLLLANTAVNKSSDINSIIPPAVVTAIEVREQFETCATHIAKLLPPIQNETFVISIAGESGSGKTTLSKALKAVLDEKGLKTVLLHQDDFFKLPPNQNHRAREMDFEHVGYSEVRLDMLDASLQQIKDQHTDVLAIPYMNRLVDTEETKVINIADVKMVIVEGTYTTMLHNPDLRIFMDTSYQLTRQNRITRGRDTITDFIENVLMKESQLIQLHKTMADLVVDNQFKIERKQ